MAEAPAFGVPQFADVTRNEINEALRRGWRDLVSAPIYALAFGGAYVLGGWFLVWLTVLTGQSYWLVFAAVGFPLIGPFAATGHYEISRRLQRGEALAPMQVFGVMLDQGRRQLPWLSAVMIVIFFVLVFPSSHDLCVVFGIVCDDQCQFEF